MARFHLTTDLATGETVRVPFTAQEETARDAEEATAAQDAAAAAAALTERTTAAGDLATQYAAAITRLDAMITNGGGFTAAQVRDATVDLARIVRRLLRLVKSQVG